MIVVDASVFVKLFKQEEESEHARALVDHCLHEATALLAPTIVLYEALSAALHVGYPFAQVHELFDRLSALGLTIEQPDGKDVTLAEKIATGRAPAGGFPTLFDSIYHAMAINRGGTFVTPATSARQDITARSRFSPTGVQSEPYSAARPNTVPPCSNCSLASRA